MKQYRHSFSANSMVEDEHGNFVRWIDYATALFKQDQRHVEELVVFSNEVEQLNDGQTKHDTEIMEHEIDIAFLEKECSARSVRIENRDTEIKLLKEECFDRIETRDTEIKVLELSVKKRDGMLIRYEEIIVRLDKAIVERNEKIDRRNRIIEARNLKIAELVAR